MDELAVGRFRKEKDGTFTCFAHDGEVLADHVTCGECTVQCKGYQKKSCSAYHITRQPKPATRSIAEPHETLWDNAKEVEPLEDYGAEKDCEQLDEAKLTKPKTRR